MCLGSVNWRAKNGKKFVSSCHCQSDAIKSGVYILKTEKTVFFYLSLPISEKPISFTSSLVLRMDRNAIHGSFARNIIGTV